MPHFRSHRFGLLGVLAGIPTLTAGLLLLIAPATAPELNAGVWLAGGVGVVLTVAGCYLCQRTPKGRPRSGDSRRQQVVPTVERER